MLQLTAGRKIPARSGQVAIVCLAVGAGNVVDHLGAVAVEVGVPVVALK